MINCKHYVLDFYKMSISNEIKGVYWESIPENIRFRSHIIAHIERMRKNQELMFTPILYINSSIAEHYTQIVHILKEHFSNLKDGFSGWSSFTKETLIKECKQNEFVYKENLSNGQHFVDAFPEKIDTFIEKFCCEI